MMELHLDAATHRTMQQFKTRKFLVGLKPLIVFSGSVFETADETAGNEWTLARSMLLDFFSGEEMSKIDAESLQWVVAISAEEPAGGSAASAPADPANKPMIRIRAYMLDTKRSGHKLPRIDLVEIGPRSMCFALLVPSKCHIAPRTLN
jgi:ribosome production factor 2